jgi:hypothetical protein
LRQEFFEGAIKFFCERKKAKASYRLGQEPPKEDWRTTFTRNVAVQYKFHIAVRQDSGWKCWHYWALAVAWNKL